MSHSAYISTTEAYSGKSLISLGLMDLLLGSTQRVAYYRPVIQSKNEKDLHTDLILKHFQLEQPYKQTYSFKISEVDELLATGKSEDVIDKVISDFKFLETNYDFVLVEGTDYVGDNTAHEFDLNVMLARNLQSPVLLVSNGSNKKPEEILRRLKVAVDAFSKVDCEVIGAVINKVEESDVDMLRLQLAERIQKWVRPIKAAVIPGNTLLASPSVREVVEQLDAEVLYGEELIDTRQVLRYAVAGMHVDNYLDRLTDDCAVVCSADRSEIILGSLQAHKSSNYPNISCIVLTGGFEVADSILKLLDGIELKVPIIKVKTNTFNSAVALSKVKSDLRAENPVKVQLALQYFHKEIDETKIDEAIITFRPKGITPKMFKYNLTQKAKSETKHIVLPEGTDPRIQQAAVQLHAANVVKLTLLGDPQLVSTGLKSFGYESDDAENGENGIQILSPRQSVYFQDYSKQLCEARKHKGLTLELAEDLMNDISYFGTMMVQMGHADGMVSGAVNTTQHTIRPALQFVKTKVGIKTVSSVFFMCLEDRVLVYGDCAVNPNPTAEQLAEIAVSSSETSIAFGIEPKIAMLSYSTGQSGKGDEVEKVRRATELAKQMNPNLLIEGPIQYDAAVDMGVGKLKMPGSQVAGQASVFIFPDLNTGNNTYKAVQRETGAIAIGPVLQGLNKPVNDLSRGCTVEDIVNTVIITAIQAQA